MVLSVVVLCPGTLRQKVGQGAVHLEVNRTAYSGWDSKCVAPGSVPQRRELNQWSYKTGKSSIQIMIHPSRDDQIPKLQSIFLSDLMRSSSQGTVYLEEKRTAVAGGRQAAFYELKP